LVFNQSRTEKVTEGCGIEDISLIFFKKGEAIVCLDIIGIIQSKVESHDNNNIQVDSLNMSPNFIWWKLNL
jgi:hypothetical protein